MSTVNATESFDNIKNAMNYAKTHHEFIELNAEQKEALLEDFKNIIRELENSN